MEAIAKHAFPTQQILLYSIATYLQITQNYTRILIDKGFRAYDIFRTHNRVASLQPEVLRHPLKAIIPDKIIHWNRFTLRKPT
jgi:hypothetical protein